MVFIGSDRIGGMESMISGALNWNHSLPFAIVSAIRMHYFRANNVIRDFFSIRL